MSDLSSLLVRTEPISPDHLVNDVAEIFSSNDYERFLCLPVVDGGRPVGTVSRHKLTNIFMTRFGRDLYGKNSVTKVMNPKPLVIDIKQAMERAALHVSRNIGSPITEDFILTDDGEYRGIGFVLDLLGAMERQIERRNVELSKALRNLKESQAQLVQSEKMASLGQMVAGVAHEINTPLGYVKNNIEMTREGFRETGNLLHAYDAFIRMISSETPDEDAITRQMQVIEELRQEYDEVFPEEDLISIYDDTLYGIEQISEMVINLKNFSRLDQAAVANVNLNDCINSSLLIAKNVLKHKAEVIKQYDAQLPTIACSPSQINQIFLNLLTNAAQAIEDGKAGRIQIRTWADSEFVYASVQDNGKGIEKAKLKKIFDPFFTTKPVGQGTGLGLSIAFKIIQQHKGTIRVGSEVGVGTRFLVSLPRKSRIQAAF